MRIRTLSGTRRGRAVPGLTEQMIAPTYSPQIEFPAPGWLHSAPTGLTEPRMDGLSLYEWHAAGVRVLMVRGELDHWSGARLEERLIALAAAGHSRIVLDVGGLRFCDAGGIGILVRGHSRARAQDGWLRLACPTRRVRHVLTLVELNGVLPIFDSVADATAGRPPSP